MAKRSENLSKSQFIQGQRCPKITWLAENRRDLQRNFNDASGAFDAPRLARIQMGDEIGQMARNYFGGGPVVEALPWEIDKGVGATQDFIAKGHDTVFEATAFNPADKTHCRVDVLRKVPGTEDEWDLVEVKSTSSVKPYHVEDITFQYHVFAGAGYKIRNCYVMLVNNQYVRQGDVDLEKFFRIEDVTAKVKAKEPAVQPAAEKLIQIRRGGMPDIPVGGHCDKPFPCEYKSFCWKDMPLPSVFNVCSAADAEAIARKTGSYDINDIPDELVPPGIKAIDIAAHKSGQEHVEPQKLQAFLDRLEYPVYFLDYETIMPTVPLYDGTRPFQNIPFQFSLHLQETLGMRPLRHHEFIHRDKTDPRKAFVMDLIKSCGEKGSILVYNSEFETRRNNELAKVFPQYAKELNAINARMIDLYEPFKNRWIYSPAQHGSGSIKHVLPAFTALKYDDLDVANGPEAMGQYTRFVRGQIEATDKFWSDLSRYCKMDTRAMVELLEVLREKANLPPPPAPQPG